MRSVKTIVTFAALASSNLVVSWQAWRRLASDSLACGAGARDYGASPLAGAFPIRASTVADHKRDL
jgi:hypothetical protein